MDDPGWLTHSPTLGKVLSVRRSAAVDPRAAAVGRVSIQGGTMPWRKNKKTGKPFLVGTCRICKKQMAVRRLPAHYDDNHPKEFDVIVNEPTIRAMDQDSEDEAVQERRDRWR